MRAERGRQYWGGVSVVIHPGKYSQATLKRLKNMPLSPHFSKFAEHSDYLLDPLQRSA